MTSALGPFTLILLLAPAIALKIAVRVLYGRRRLAVADPLQMFLSLAGAVMFALAILGIVVGLAGFWWMLIPLPFVLIVALLMVVDRVRHAEHRAVIWALATAAERGVPLSEAARAYADESLGDTGTRALAVAEGLERGQSLSQAARAARLRMSSAMRLAIRIGESLGVLGPAMRQQLHDSQQLDGEMQNVIARFFYLLNVVVVMIGVITFIMWKIIPIFDKMFQEFGLKLPPLTHLLIDSSRWFVHWGWLAAVPIIPILPVFFILALMYYVGYFPRGLPLLWRLFRRYDGVLVMRGMALAIRRNLPMPQAMFLVGDQYPLSIIGFRLRDAAQEVALGQDWRQALLRHKLIGQAEVGVLAAAERVGNLPWALEQMADSALRRQMQRLQVLLQILFPICVLLFGMVLFLVAGGIFLPLVSLIQGLA